MKTSKISTKEIEILLAENKNLKKENDRLKVKNKTAVSQKKFFKNILNGIPSDLVVFDRHHRYQFLNPISIKDKIMRNWMIDKTDFDYCRKRNQPIQIAKNRRKIFNQVIREKKEISFEEKMIDIDGNTVWNFRRMHPVFNSNNDVEHVIGYAYDITHIKKMKVDLESAQKKGEVFIKAKESFLANMSHEIRTPMNAILGMSQLLSNIKLSKKNKMYLNGISKSASNLLVIINEILDYSKINSNKLNIEKIPVNLFEELNNCEQLFILKCEEKGIRLVKSISKELENTYIKSDPVRLNQVLNNLVSNAVKFTKKGTVNLNIELIKSTKDQLTIQFSIIDTGAGIPKSKLNHIFNPFSQADTSVTREYGGTGLGLTISKKIVNLMGGELSVLSEENSGSNFSFILNFKTCKSPSITKQKKHIKNPTLNKKLKILLVEDNPLNQLYAQSVLEKHIKNLTIVNNGEEAIKVINNQKFDLILMDIQMPIMGGLECTKIIRKVKNIQTPIIALTANAFKEDRALYLQTGMNSYLSKPFSEQELISEISNVIGNTKIIIPNQTRAKKINLPPAMINLFISEMNKNIKLFELHVSENDIQSINRLAHKIKPNLSMFGLEKVIPLCLNIEKCTKINKTEISKLTTSISNMIQHLK